MKLSPWDFAAAVLLCLESGARVTNFRGEQFTLSEGQAVAANPVLHPQLLEVIAEGRRP